MDIDVYAALSSPKACLPSEALVLLSSQALLKSFVLQRGFHREGGAVGPPKADTGSALDKVCLGSSLRSPSHSQHQRKEGAPLNRTFGP